MGLQIDIAQNVSHRPWADARNDSVRHGLAGQVITRPMRDVQPFGHGLQTSKLNDLCPLHGGDPQVTARVTLPLIGKQSAESQVPIPLTRSPDGGFVALKLGSDVFAPLARSNTQNNASTPNLIPRRRITVSYPFQLGDIRREERQHFGFPATHASTSHAETEHGISIAGCWNSVQVFVPATLDKKEELVTLALLDALQNCTSISEHILVLDWDHPCYRFFPHEGTHKSFRDYWAIPVWPKYDSHYFVSTVFDYGLLANRLGKIHVFGKALVDASYLTISKALGSPVSDGEKGTA